jgi:hypothetical protein
MVIKYANPSTDLGREEIAVLVERQLVALNTDEGSLRITELGDWLLETLSSLSCVPRSS